MNLILCPRCLGYYSGGYEYMMHNNTGNCPVAPFDFAELEEAYLAEDKRIADEIGDDGGHDFTFCTKIAEFCQKLVPNSKVVGFFAEDNPEAKVNEYADGHDFLLVEDRYLVDFWVRDVAGVKDAPVVIDLNKDTFMATKWYGQKKYWKHLED